MRKLISGLVFLLSTTASAHDGGPSQWVGQTTAPLVGTAGFLTLTTRCRTDFGPGARMCTGSEIQGSSTLEMDGIVDEGCWVRPETIAIGAQGIALDKTGIVLTGTGGVDCAQWSPQGFSGLIFGPDGRFALGQCNEARPVACCAPDSASKSAPCRGSHCRSR